MRKCWLGGIAGFSLVLLALLGWLDPSSAQPDDLRLPPNVETQINTIVQQSTAPVHQVLKRHGFPPPGVKLEDWRGTWSATGSLDLAYRSAEKAAPGSGRELLNRIHWDYVALNPAMAAPEGPRPAGQRSFKFASLVAADLESRLPEPAERIVRAISRHADAKLRGFLGRCCGIDDARLERIIRESSSVTDAIRSVLRDGRIPPELRTRLALLLEGVVSTNPAIAFDGELANLRRDLLALNAPEPRRVSAITPSDPAVAKRYGNEAAALDAALDRQLKSVMETAKVASASDMALGQHIADAFSQPPPGAGGSGGGSPSAPHDGSRLATAADRAFDLRTYGPSALPTSPNGARPAPSGNAFSRVITRSGGRGGVVFGADVDSSAISVAPLSVSWIPLEASRDLTAETKGSFRIRLADDRLLYAPPVAAGVALAAVRIALTGRSGLASRHVEQAEIGLAGLVSRFDVPEVTSQGVAAPSALSRSCADFVVHPAVVDTPVGHAAIVLDGLLLGQNQPVLGAILAGPPTDAQRRIDFERFRSVTWNTYKFVESPLTLSLNGERGIVRALAANPAGQATASAPRVIWTRFKSGTAVEDDPVQAQAAMLTLRAASAEYALLESFAEQLAILRWAASKNATWLGGVDDGARSSVATALCRHDAKFELVPSRYVLAVDVAERVAVESSKLIVSTRFADNLRQHNDQITMQRRQIVELASLGSLFNERLQEQAKPPAVALEQALAKIIRTIPRMLMKPGQVSTIVEDAFKEPIATEVRVGDTMTQQRQEIWNRDPGKLPLIDAWNGFIATLSSTAKATVNQAYPDAIPTAFIRWHAFQTTFATACPGGLCAR